MINWIGLFIFLVCFAGLLSSSVTARATQSFLSPLIVRVLLVVFLAALGVAQLDLWPTQVPLVVSMPNGILRIVSLWVHEAGHALFSFDGQILAVLGGTLLQLLIPIGAALYLALLRSFPCPGWIMLFWCGHSLNDVAGYVADARTRALPLLGGAKIHDWNYLLSAWGLLEQDLLIAKIVRVVAGLVMLYALALLCFFPGSTQPFRPTGEVSAHE